MKEFLSRTATTYGGRNGEIKDTNSGMTYKLATPIEMGGDGQEGTNPEELFSVGYSSCFASSLEYLLKNAKVQYEDLYVKAETKLMAIPNEGFRFKLVVEARIKGVDEKTQEIFVEMARGFCPYSKAIQGNVEVEFI